MSAKLCQTKCEQWVASALAADATAKRLQVFIASENDESPERPALFISCINMSPSPGFLWSDKQRTCEIVVSVESAVKEPVAAHLERALHIEAALQNQDAVKGFAASVEGGLYVYNYDIGRASKDASAETRFYEIVLTAMVWDKAS